MSEGSEILENQPTNVDGESEQVEEQVEDDAFNIFIKTCTDDNITLTLQVTLGDNMQDIKQYVFEMVNTSFITCYDFYYNGSKVNEYSDFGDIPEIKPDAVFEMREALYDERSIRVHVNRLRGVLASPLEMSMNPAIFSTINNVDDSVAIITTTQEAQKTEEKTEEKEGEEKEEKGEEKEEEKKEVRIEFDATKLSFTEIEPKLSSFHPQVPFIPLVPAELSVIADKPSASKKKNAANSTENAEKSGWIPAFTTQNLSFIKGLNLSGWNPPPSNRKLRGDLIYLELVTYESKIYHITGTPKGFYVNSSNSTAFNPNPMVNTPTIKHCLASLISLLSPQFKKNLNALNSMEFGRHAFEGFPTAMETFNWLSSPQRHKFDASSPEEFSLSLVDPDLRTTGQLREWNEEYQICKELPRNTVQERAMRERAIFRTISDFIVAAKRGAVSIVNRTVVPINPLDSEKAQMFVYNNIFFSFVCDSRELFKETGGDRAAHVSANNDLKGIRALNLADVEGLHTLATALIDYRGYRMCAQSIIPGILQREQTSQVVYGSMDNGKQVVGNEDFHKLFDQAAQQLHVLEHKVKSDKEVEKEGENGEKSTETVRESVTISAPVEVKGIVGTDSRKYVLDIIRLTPRDTNFEGPEKNVTILRKELIDRFCEYLLAIKKVEEKKAKPEEENKEKSAEEADQQFLMDQSYLSSIRFNPNVLCGLEIDAPEEEIKSQEELVRCAGNYLITNVIPKFVRDSISMVYIPSDGFALVKQMHRVGINLRYLGMIATLASKNKSVLLHKVALREMIVRASKHIFRQVLNKTPDYELAFTVSHLLNLLLSSKNVSAEPTPSASSSQVEEKPSVSSPSSNGNNADKKKKRGKKVKSTPQSNATKTWGYENECPAKSMSSDSLWAQIVEQVKSKFQFDLEGKKEQYNYILSNYATLKEVCKLVGLQLNTRDYDFSSTNVFTVDDVLDLVPLCKHVLSDGLGQEMLEFAKSSLLQGRKEFASEIYQDALIALHQIYGPIHPDVAECYQNLAAIYNHNRDFVSAVDHQQKAVVILEKVYGPDHYETVYNYATLGLYCHHASKPKTALAFMQRAIYVSKLFIDITHPDSSGLLSSLAVMLQDFGKHQQSIAYFNESLKGYEQLFGPDHINLGALYHAIAISYALMDDFKEALRYEKKHYTALRTQLSEEDERVAECNQYLKSFTSRAVQDLRFRTQPPPKFNQQQLKALATKKGIDPNAFAEIAAKLSKDPKSMNELVHYLNEVKPATKSFAERNQRRRPGQRRNFVHSVNTTATAPAPSDVD
eukprot:TRINITY_DN4206_c0_g1_i1.p1 TRINITY_DN4206_c0_g1~~TRINITY_DN4206_c0_g1_i1.p1  ORF type:complete len:1296 (-),score=607.29 TRINITY_DN4206_c0_g1_i1:314-4201(-)